MPLTLNLENVTLHQLRSLLNDPQLVQVNAGGMQCCELGTCKAYRNLSLFTLPFSTASTRNDI